MNVLLVQLLPKVRHTHHVSKDKLYTTTSTHVLIMMAYESYPGKYYCYCEFWTFKTDNVLFM